MHRKPCAGAVSLDKARSGYRGRVSRPYCNQDHQGDDSDSFHRCISLEVTRFIHRTVTQGAL